MEDKLIDILKKYGERNENNLKIKIIVYRQGSLKPELKSF